MILITITKDKKYRINQSLIFLKISSKNLIYSNKKMF